MALVKTFSNMSLNIHHIESICIIYIYFLTLSFWAGWYPRAGLESPSPSHPKEEDSHISCHYISNKHSRGVKCWWYYGNLGRKESMKSLHCQLDEKKAAKVPVYILSPKSYRHLLCGETHSDSRSFQAVPKHWLVLKYSDTGGFPWGVAGTLRMRSLRKMLLSHSWKGDKGVRAKEASFILKFNLTFHFW